MAPERRIGKIGFVGRGRGPLMSLYLEGMVSLCRANGFDTVHDITELSTAAAIDAYRYVTDAIVLGEEHQRSFDGLDLVTHAADFLGHVDMVRFEHGSMAVGDSSLIEAWHAHLRTVNGLQGSRVLVCGAGPMGRAASLVLKAMGAHVVVTSRSERSLELARDLNVRHCEWDARMTASENMGGFVALVNATPLGRHGGFLGQTPWGCAYRLPYDCVGIFDPVVTPRRTPLENLGGARSIDRMIQYRGGKDFFTARAYAQCTMLTGSDLLYPAAADLESSWKWAMTEIKDNYVVDGFNSVD